MLWSDEAIFSLVILHSLVCLQVTDSIYDLVGAEVPAKVKVQNLERVFGSMDSDKDGVISLEEFTVYCSTNTHVLDSLAVLPWATHSPGLEGSKWNKEFPKGGI